MKIPLEIFSILFLLENGSALEQKHDVSSLHFSDYIFMEIFQVEEFLGREKTQSS